MTNVANEHRFKISNYYSIFMIDVETFSWQNRKLDLELPRYLIKKDR